VTPVYLRLRALSFHLLIGATSSTFIKGYSSPTIKDFQPALSLSCEADFSNQNGPEPHFSSAICRRVYDSGKIIWAEVTSSHEQAKPFEVPLKTIIGVPLRSDDQFFVAVLFAVEAVPVTTGALEHLTSLVRVVPLGIDGYHKSGSVSGTPDPQVQSLKHYELLLSIDEDMSPSTTSDQSAVDCGDAILFRDAFKNFKLSRKPGFTDNQLATLRNGISCSPPTSQDEARSLWRFAPHAERKEATDAGVYCADDVPLPPAYQSRFHEFMIAVLAISVFDSCELWLRPSPGTELHLMAAVYRTAAMQKWTSSGISLRLQPGTDVPGRVLATAQNCWDPYYCEEMPASQGSADAASSGGSAQTPATNSLRPPRNGPRMSFARELGLLAALGVPVPGPRGPRGALVFYSTKRDRELDPLLVEFVTTAVYLMSDMPQSASLPPSSVNGRSASSEAGYTAYNRDEPVTGSGDPSPAESGAPTSHNEEIYSDAVVSAARALANFGNFQWGAFLEGSGIEDAAGNYMNSQVSTEKLLGTDLMSIGASRKRKVPSAGSSSFDSGGLTPVPIPYGGGVPVCLVAGCGYYAESADAQYCATHRGTRRCQHEGCGKCAQGATKYCIAHGGGRRCTFPGCYKGARDKLYCAAHGGGKRCTFEGCTKSAVGGSSYCTGHGGGKRCKFEGCNKSSQSSTDFCVKHGGGRSCSFKGCSKVITSSFVSVSQ
jgi:hypothetical protein